MSVLSRYMSRELVKLVVVSLVGVAVIYLVIDFIDRIDNFLRAHAALSSVAEYFLFKIPFIVQQGIPMSVLMGTLITLGVLARTNELTALRAAGVSPFAASAALVASMSLVESVTCEMPWIGSGTPSRPFMKTSWRPI